MSLAKSRTSGVPNVIQCSPTQCVCLSFAYYSENICQGQIFVSLMSVWLLYYFRLTREFSYSACVPSGNVVNQIQGHMVGFSPPDHGTKREHSFHVELYIIAS